MRFDRLNFVLFNLHNVKRRQWGRDPVKESKNLDEIAQKHSDFLAKNRWLPFRLIGHWGFKGRAKDAQIVGFSGYFAENVAFNSIGNLSEDKLAEVVMSQWMFSIGHRTNIMGDYSHIGIGITNNNDTLYYTVVFAK